MAEEVTISLYHWDFDRKEPDFDLAFETCSIAIFQWQPKAGGKGLKKVNAARVCGFSCDLKGLYAKARAICDQLNAERADVMKRPEWLQKQYSVPRPKSLPEPLSNKASRSSVYTIRERVMQRILLPEGFVRAKNATWVCTRGDQIHLVNFQAARFVREYTVNLGLHYSFIPPLTASKEKSLTEFQELDCGLRARIGEFLAEKGDRWFEIGDDSAELERIFEQNARDCLRVFDEAERLFARPEETFLNGDGTAKDVTTAQGWWVHDRRFLDAMASHVRSSKFGNA